MQGHLRRPPQASARFKASDAHLDMTASCVQAELQNPQRRHPTHSKPEVIASSSTPLISHAGDYTDGSTGPSTPGAASIVTATRGRNCERTKSIYGAATKVDVAYKNMIKKASEHASTPPPPLQALTLPPTKPQLTELDLNTNTNLNLNLNLMRDQLDCRLLGGGSHSSRESLPVERTRSWRGGDSLHPGAHLPRKAQGGLVAPILLPPPRRQAQGRHAP